MAWAASLVRRQIEHAESLAVGKPIVMTGGAAKSTIWPQIIADLCNVTVQAIVFDELTAYGAACYAADAAGKPFDSTLHEIAQTRIYEPVNPDSYQQWYDMIFPGAKNA